MAELNLLLVKRIEQTEQHLYNFVCQDVDIVIELNDCVGIDNYRIKYVDGIKALGQQTTQYKAYRSSDLVSRKNGFLSLKDTTSRLSDQIKFKHEGANSNRQYYKILSSAIAKLEEGKGGVDPITRCNRNQNLIVENGILQNKMAFHHLEGKIYANHRSMTASFYHLNSRCRYGGYHDDLVNLFFILQNQNMLVYTKPKIHFDNFWNEADSQSVTTRLSDGTNHSETKQYKYNFLELDALGRRQVKTSAEKALNTMNRDHYNTLLGKEMRFGVDARLLPTSYNHSKHDLFNHLSLIEVVQESIQSSRLIWKWKRYERMKRIYGKQGISSENCGFRETLGIIYIRYAELYCSLFNTWHLADNRMVELQRSQSEGTTNFFDRNEVDLSLREPIESVLKYAFPSCQVQEFLHDAYYSEEKGFKLYEVFLKHFSLYIGCIKNFEKDLRERTSMELIDMMREFNLFVLLTTFLPGVGFSDERGTAKLNLLIFREKADASFTGSATGSIAIENYGMEAYVREYSLQLNKTFGSTIEDFLNDLAHHPFKFQDFNVCEDQFEWEEDTRWTAKWAEWEQQRNIELNGKREVMGEKFTDFKAKWNAETAKIKERRDIRRQILKLAGEVAKTYRKLLIEKDLVIYKEYDKICRDAYKYDMAMSQCGGLSSVVSFIYPISYPEKQFISLLIVDSLTKTSEAEALYNQYVKRLKSEGGRVIIQILKDRKALSDTYLTSDVLNVRTTGIVKTKIRYYSHNAVSGILVTISSDVAKFGTHLYFAKLGAVR
ncbi:VP3 [Umatilla virus]|uniref:VP3 n=1 Tax=Umatilla virus TaxID=40060 RepID=G8DP04_9REOV|nr:VP3 [Umatilla virus]AEE98370.1 VP3 [Umatilla virus]